MQKIHLLLTTCILLAIVQFTISQGGEQSGDVVASAIERGQEAELARDIEKACEFYKRAYESAGTVEGPMASEAALRLGAVYAEKGYQDQATQCLQRALEGFAALGDDYKSRLAMAHFEAGELSYISERYDEAMRHFEQGVGHLGSVAEVNPLDLARLKNGCAKACLATRQPDLAREYFKAAIADVETARKANEWELFHVQMTIATQAARGGANFAELATEAYGQAMKSAKSLPENRDAARVEVHLSKGRFHLEQRQGKDALKELKEAVRLSERTYTAPHPVVALCKASLSRALMLNGEVAEAQAMVEQAVAAAGTQRSSHELLDALLARAELANALGQGDIQGDIEAAVKALQELRILNRERGQRIELGPYAQKISRLSVSNLYRSYSQTRDESLAKKAFLFAGQAKASSLYDALRELETRKVAGISPEQLTRERRIRADLAWYEKALYNLQKYPEGVPAGKIEELSARRDELQREYLSLIAELEKNYPRYFGLSFNSNVATVEDVQAGLGKDMTLVEYLLGDSLVYIFTVDQKKVDITAVPYPKPLLSAVGPFLISLKTSDYAAFLPAGHLLYQTLIEPVKDRIAQSRQLLIVPDGEMNYISFELLLCQQPAEADGDFRTLDYLMNHHQVLYNYSASLYLKSRALSALLTPKKPFAGFAPDFANYDYIAMRSRIESIDDTSSVFANLPGAEAEVKKLAELLKGDLFLGPQATEENFKKTSGEYNVLHLATHTVINNSNPLFSKLVLTPSGDEDGLLNTYELFSLDLNAELVTLSACNSGIGNLEEGEGVMSLARGFAYAGSPNVVMSLWPVPDASTELIMEFFYKHLLAGKEKSEALRQSKMDYLKASSRLTGSPYYWGCFVVIGNDDPMKWASVTPKSWKVPFWVWASSGAGLLVLLLAGILLSRQRAKVEQMPVIPGAETQDITSDNQPEA